MAWRTSVEIPLFSDRQSARMQPDRPSHRQFRSARECAPPESSLGCRLEWVCRIECSPTVLKALEKKHFCDSGQAAEDNRRGLFRVKLLRAGPAGCRIPICRSVAYARTTVPDGRLSLYRLGQPASRGWRTSRRQAFQVLTTIVRGGARH